MGSICISCGQYYCRGYVPRVHDRDDLAGPCWGRHRPILQQDDNNIPMRDRVLL
jgi:hypothetical protein